MIKSFCSSRVWAWVRALVMALVAITIGAGTALAASPAQTPTGDSSVFDNLLFVVIGAVLMALFASVAGGVIIAVLATGVSRFFRRNLPTEEEMAEMRAEVSKADQRGPQRRIQVGPTAEPFVISAVGFVVFLLLVSIGLGAIPQPVRGEEVAGEATPATAEGLPKSGDLANITDGLPRGNPDNGVRVFNSVGCVGCHSQKEGERLVGPAFYNLWNTAATRVPGLDAKEYLYQSIVNPNAHVVEGFQPNIMQQNYASLLSPQQMADILAWIEERHSNE